MKNINYSKPKLLETKKKKREKNILNRTKKYKESNLTSRKTNQREGFKDYKRVALFAAALKFNWIGEGMEFEYNSSEWKGVSSFACAGSSSHAMTVCIPTRGADSEIQGCVDELIVSQSGCHSLETCGQRCDLR